MGCVSFVKAFIARLLFGIHGVVTVWRVTTVESSPIFYVLLIPVALLPVEMGVTLKCTETGEWKWLCPSVFLYLLSVVPGLWLMQIDLYDTRIEYRDQQGWESCSSETVYNQTGLEEIQGVTIPVALSDDQWALALEQILLCLLILGRWLLPKGSLTRDQLSQLLLVYIGMAADILEFNLENLKEENIFCDIVLIVFILGLWSWSLLQFTLVLTSVSGRRRRHVRQDGSRSCTEDCCVCCTCCQNEMWSLWITLIMQDGPFLAMRLYLMIHVKIFNIMMIFFTCKNILVILLQLYRMMILCGAKNEVAPAEDEEKASGSEDCTNKTNRPEQVVVVSS